MDTNKNEHTAATQRQRIRAAMESGGAYTALDALKEFGSLSFAKRISELVAVGFPIQKEWIKTESGKHVVRYSKGGAFTPIADEYTRLGNPKK